MTRIARYRLGYGAALVALAGVVALVLAWMGTSPAVLIGLGLLLMVPGRVQGVLFRDLFAGTRLLRAGRAAAAIPVLERFLATIRARPRRKRAMWLSWPGWSADVEARRLGLRGGALDAIQATLAGQLAPVEGR